MISMILTFVLEFGAPGRDDQPNSMRRLGGEGGDGGTHILDEDVLMLVS